jgi:YHS domain-containing protein
MESYFKHLHYGGFMNNTIRSMCLATVLASGIIALSWAQTATAPAKIEMVHQTVAAKTDTHTAKLQPQTACPVTGDPIDKKLYVDYKGKRIYVCCSGCLATVKKNPEKYIKKLEKMGQGVEAISDNSKKEGKDSKADTSVKGMDMKGMKMSGDTAGKAAVGGYWTCPMHPEIHQATPGNCPICGMKLEYRAPGLKKKTPAAKADTAMNGMKM